MTDINNLIHIISKLQGDLDETKRRLRLEITEKEKALTRLSAIAGSKLIHNNPGITDLSDQNRPQKLGEKFNELYDNEWTDAMDQMSSDQGEKKAAVILRQILEVIYKKTKKDADTQCKKLQEALFQRDLRKSEACNFLEIYQKISNLQREVSSLSTDNAKRVLRDDSEFRQVYEPVMCHCEPYFEKCVELCWMMHIQDPPMCLDFGSSTEVIDKNVFRLFTRNGDRVDFTVWPAVLLHEDGPIVQKGVVQPKKITKS